MGTIIHIELTSTAPEKTADFYARAFGWESTASPHVPDYLLTRIGDGPGIDAAVMSSRYQAQNTILWIDVPDIDAAIAAVEAAGGSSAGDVLDLPGEGRVGYVEDPDGVVLGLKQSS